MKKSILNLGKALNKAEQKSINGGSIYPTMYDERCETADRPSPPGCPCSSSSTCQYSGTPSYNSDTKTWSSPEHGNCYYGTCA